MQDVLVPAIGFFLFICTVFPLLADKIFLKVLLQQSYLSVSVNKLM